MGSGYFQFSITGLALGAGAIAHSKPLINFGLDNLQAQIFTSGITLFVKELTHRARPEEGEGAYKWYGPFKGSGNESFFSGHTSLSFCTATMIFLHSHKKWWVGVLGYTMATGIGVSRMQKEKHWASDVIVGATVGTAVASFVYRQQQKRRENNQKLTVIP
jgi:membrane-associated phospholipid phosphatase